MKKLTVTLLAFTLLTFFLWSQTTYNAGMEVPENGIRSGEEGFASEGFRRGVQAYYKGAYNESIVEFEKALSYLPNDNLILEWLGKAYYKSGMEGSALSYWQTAADNGYGGLLLQNKIEIVKERRVTGDSRDKLMRLSEAGSYNGTNNGNLVFSGPVSVLPNNDGTMWISAYNSNELVKINLNGKISERITGPLNGFDRPMDLIRLSDGKLLLSEAAGDRLSLLDEKGHFIKYIGSKGCSDGNLVGPQYLATDYMDRIYVTDNGNRRIAVFDKDGTGLFTFGKKSSEFEGLKNPTGIAVCDERVFIADETYGCIFEFDRAGNFIRELVEKNTFKKPEALKYWQDSLIVCDENKIISVDTDTGALFEYARTGNAPSRVTSATPDVNNNVIVTDFTANEVYVMSKMQELVGGLFVQIDQIDASKFPQVTVEVKVENRHRQPVVGLQLENFYLSENKRPVTGLTYVGAATNNTSSDITIVIDRSNSSKNYRSEIEAAVKEIAAGMKESSVLRIVSAGVMPVTEYQGKPSAMSEFSVDALKNPYAKNISVDLALRLASNDLINSAKKRSIIMITPGSSTETGFEKYNLSEIAAFMNNNSVGFSMVQVSQAGIDSQFDYLIKNTFGDVYYVFRPEGLKNIVRDIIDIPQGVYQLEYTSTLATNFGENYLPLETEVYLLNRSGRDESGYFAPLQ